MFRGLALGATACAAFVFACGGSDGDTGSQANSTTTKDGGGVRNDGGGASDGGSSNDGGSSGDSSSGDGGIGTSNIAHVVIIIQENHTFDAYFGRYCTAPAGSNPTCTTGPSCCERAPDKDPSGASPVTLDDSENAGYDPNHTQSCELDEMNGGAMDRYVTGASCSNAKNFAIADQAVAQYHTYAGQYAIADRYFQPLVGQSSSNDMYFAVAKYVFTDNAYQPNTNGHGCDIPPTATIEYSGQKTIADVLVAGGKTFSFYAEGYQAMINATLCPLPPSDCPEHVPTPPCVYSPSDNPFQYYTQLADNRTYEKDWDQFAQDINAKQLPNVSFIKPLQYKNEHPGYGTTLSAGQTFVKGVVDTIAGSSYANDTLVLVTWDEGGGFFDHVKPPPDSVADGKPYGTRVPVIAIGRFARKNHVSHVVMEHSSIVRFVEYNFLGGKTGQLGARDAIVNNIGSLLDPLETGIVVPE
jgi:phospholipase C